MSSSVIIKSATIAAADRDRFPAREVWAALLADLLAAHGATTATHRPDFDAEEDFLTGAITYTVRLAPRA